jgi:hypothetical protein
MIGTHFAYLQRWKAGGDVVRSKLVDGEGVLQWLSDDDEGTYGCGGAQRISSRRWFDMRKHLAARRR